MAIKNDLLYNAAVIGFFTGALAGNRSVNASVTATDYAALKDAAIVMATAVDALISEDATITTGGGDASQLAIGVVSDNAFNEQAKGQLMTILCRNCVEYRTPVASTAASAAWAASTQPAKIVAQYTEALLALSNAA